MLTVRLTPKGDTIGGSTAHWLYEIGPYGAWSDLNLLTRFADGMCGNFELSWSMPLPPGFEHDLLRRGTVVELMDGPYRIGSPFVMSEPAVGAGLSEPWRITCTGIGREVEGENSYYALDGSGNTTAIPSTAWDAAITRGLAVDGRTANVPTTAIGGASTTDELMSIGSLLNAADQVLGKRHLVNQANLLDFVDIPTDPIYQINPGSAALGTADDDYATVVLLRYENSATPGVYATAYSPLTTSATETRFGRREYAVNLMDKGAISTATAQAWADGILAKSKGRLAWTNGLTVTSNEILTMGGVPANLSKVAEDVGNGCMVQLNGTWSDLLETTGALHLDIVLGEARYIDGSPTIDLAPAGLAARDLARVVEEVTGFRSAA